MGRTKKTEKCPKVSIALKKRLAAIVEQKQVLWKFSHPKYKNKDVRDASWRSAADEIGLEGTNEITCLYNNFSKGKSGSLIRLLLWESMKYYSEGKPQIQTLSSLLLERVLRNEEDDDVGKMQTEQAPESPEGDCSNEMGTHCLTKDDSTSGLDTIQKTQIATGSKVYDYACTKRKEVVNKTESETDKLVSSLSSFIMAKQSAIEQRTSVKLPVLKFLSIYTNLDRILSKLPESVVEDLNMQFVSLAHAELKKQESVQVVCIQN